MGVAFALSTTIFPTSGSNGRLTLNEVKMAGCDGITFNGVTRNGWNAIKQSAASYGISGGDSGHATTQGFSLAWRYNESAKSLHIQCLDAPDIVPCSEINSRLRSTLRQVVADAGESFEDASMIA